MILVTSNCSFHFWFLSELNLKCLQTKNTKKPFSLSPIAGNKTGDLKAKINTGRGTNVHNITPLPQKIQMCEKPNFYNKKNNLKKKKKKNFSYLFMFDFFQFYQHLAHIFRMKKNDRQSVSARFDFIKCSNIKFFHLFDSFMNIINFQANVMKATINVFFPSICEWDCFLPKGEVILFWYCSMSQTLSSHRALEYLLEETHQHLIHSDTYHWTSLNQDKQ